MPPVKTTPVGDSVPKINNEFAVGSDLEFQVRWHRFERIVWSLLVVFLGLSLAGVFGRGPVANAKAEASDGSMKVDYERVQRFGTPSVLVVQFPPSSIQDGTIRLSVGDSLVKPLGAQRVVPQPLRSEMGNNSILYTFPANGGATSVEFQTQPSALGRSKLTLQIPGKAPVELHIFVMP